MYRRTHASTVIPSQFRKVLAVSFVRERVEISGGDFIDLDWAASGSKKVAVLCHGLEGSSQRPYMLGMTRALGEAGWDIAAYNFRGCSGEPNWVLRSYHSGATDDLQIVLDHVIDQGYRELALVGFSLGGNLVLKYLGENPGSVHRAVQGAVAISAPVSLADGAYQLARSGNRFYQQRFLRKLGKKIRSKAKLLPGKIDATHLAHIRTLIEFDDHYTAPLHGFIDAADYYARCSSRQWLRDIRISTLLINARNDPFLGEDCYPEKEARGSGCFFLETPEFGGHVGFHAPGGVYWSEQRAVDFLGRNSPEHPDV